MFTKLDDTVLASRGTNRITSFNLGQGTIVPIERQDSILIGTAVSLRDQAGLMITVVITEIVGGDTYRGTVVGDSSRNDRWKTTVEFHDKFVHNVLLTGSNS